VAIVAEASRFDRTRLLKWILSWAGLSAAFHLEDGEAPDGALQIARLAASRLA
jgi:streptomycin 6-kinase